jgi:hypothetical protein
VSRQNLSNFEAESASTARLTAPTRLSVAFNDCGKLLISDPCSAHGSLGPAISHPPVSRPQSSHCKYSRDGVRRTTSSCPPIKHLRLNRCTMCVPALLNIEKSGTRKNRATERPSSTRHPDAFVRQRKSHVLSSTSSIGGELWPLRATHAFERVASSSSIESFASDHRQAQDCPRGRALVKWCRPTAQSKTVVSAMFQRLRPYRR